MSSICLDLRTFELCVKDAKKKKKEYVRLSVFPADWKNDEPEKLSMEAIGKKDSMYAMYRVPTNPYIEKLFEIQPGTPAAKNTGKSKKNPELVYVWLAGLLTIARQIRTYGSEYIKISLNRNPNGSTSLHIWGTDDENKSIKDYGVMKTDDDVQNIFNCYQLSPATETGTISDLENNEK